MKKYRLFIYFLLVLNIVGCTAAQLGAYTIPKEVIDREYTKSYSADISQVVASVKETIDDLDWVLLEEHSNILTPSDDGKASWKIRTRDSLDSEYQLTWTAVSPLIQPEDLVLIKLRTPMTWVSGGASIFLGIEYNDGVVTLRASGSTTQIVEKQKLDNYIQQLVSIVDKKVGAAE